MPPRLHPLAASLALAALCACATAASASGPAARAATLDVDLTALPQRLLRSRLVLPARPGPMALVYPKWLPGEHSPTGPLTELAGLIVRAGGRALPWRRDEVDLFKVHLQVPEGASEIEVQLQVTSPPPGGSGRFTTSVSMTPNMGVLSWNSVLVYPEGTAMSELPVRASLKLPQGWRFATALPVSSRDGAAAAFSSVTLEHLVDSPVLMGAYLADVPLGELRGAPVTLHVSAETPEEVVLPDAQKAHLAALVREEAALFGARHFSEYHFLVSLSDAFEPNGVEHHQSSDDRLGGRALLDKEYAVSASLVELLAHESVHSWNGKYRRPVGLAPRDFQEPLKGGLLWVYEGLTQYLGNILTARSGALDAQGLRDHYAYTAETMRLHSAGRAWRPLQDTAIAAQLLYFSRDDGRSVRRSVDFYPEGDLIWLEMDVRLREATGGKVTLDDFCKRFHGGGDSGPQVSTYAFEDVARELDAIAPGLELGKLWRERLDATGGDAPLEGLLRAGWKLDYSETPSELYKALEHVEKVIDLRSSIGLVVDAEKGVVLDVVPGTAADNARVASGSKLVAVNGRKASPERLHSAVAATKAGGRLELLTENAETYLTHVLEWKGGLRYPQLVRVEGRPDLLSQIGAPRAPKGP
jgi:predicted metalloprotease with PDZ domain